MGNVSTFAKLRALNNWKRHNPAVTKKLPSRAVQPDAVNLEDLRAVVRRDQGLSSEQRSSVLSTLNDPSFLNTLRGGTVGASLSYLIAKFLRLKPQTQLLLSLAGFGIGKMIYNHRYNPQNFSRYNEKLRMYEIND